MVAISVHLLEDDECITIFRDTLTFHSGHFTKLFEEDPNRRTIVVPDISMRLFKIIEYWLRTGNLFSVQRLSYADTTSIYNFGDTYAIPRLRNAVIDLVFTTIFKDQLFPLSALNDVYNRTRLHCSLRALLVDIAIAVYSWDNLITKSELLPKAFLLEVIHAIRGKTVRLGLTMFPVGVWYATMVESLCTWHEHVEPVKYTSGGVELKVPEAECIHSADCGL